MKLLIDILKVVWDILWNTVQSAIQWVVRPDEKVVIGDICLITGSASRTGRQFAIEFGKRGATLVLWDVDAMGNEETAKEVRNLGAKAYVYTCDVGRREQIYEVAERVKREVGDVTILINNSDIIAGKPFLQCEDGELERTLKINCHSKFWTVKAFLPRMIELNRGHIITVSSHLGLVAAAYMEGYCTSQFAAVGFHESLSIELKARKIDTVKTTLICSSMDHTLPGITVRKNQPMFASSLIPERFARRAVTAILTDQPIIYLPRNIYLVAFLKQILPWDTYSLWYSFLGADCKMSISDEEKSVLEKHPFRK
ncbi:retinol dehydrogenase 10-like [Rhinophrynus dorsalis]